MCKLFDNIKFWLILRYNRRRKKLVVYFERKYLMGKVNIITKHSPWVSYRSITASEEPLSATEKKGVNVPADAFKIPEAMNNIELRISTQNSGDSCIGVYFYGARFLDRNKGIFDDISLIGSAVMTSGNQLSSSNYYYIHLVVLTDVWITDVHNVDGKGNNGMSRIAFDASGYDVFFVRIKFIDDTDWKLDISGW